MDIGRQARVLEAAALFCAVAFGAGTVHAQDYGTRAILAVDYTLEIPAVQVGEKFYRVYLTYEGPSWLVAAAVNIHPRDSAYTAGSYTNGVLDLDCVYHNGKHYSARLVSAGPQGRTFTLASATKLAACPLPDGIGPARGAWIKTAASPLGARSEVSLAWLGGEIIVFGGRAYFCRDTASCAAPSAPPFRDGAAYNPVTDSWRRLADAPVGIGGSTVTAGNAMFVLTYPDYTLQSVRLLRYRPAQNSWDEIALPASPAGMTLAAFGADLVLYSRGDEYGAKADWLLDTATGQWTQVPEDPLGAGFSRRYVALGEDLYLFDHALTPSPGGASGPSYLRAARLRGQRWETLPTAPSIGSAPDLVDGRRLIAPALGCADGGQINGYGRCIPFGAVFDTETDTWQELPAAPGRGITYFPSSGGFGDGGLVLYDPGHPALDATTNSWFIVPALDTDPVTVHNVQAVGPYGFVSGGAGFGGELLHDTWIWRP